MNKILITIAAIGCLGFSATPSQAAGFECPRLDELDTPALADEINTLLPNGPVLDQPDKLASAITLLREHGLSTDNTINHLVALYCPVVAAETDLSPGEKTDNVRHFAQQATKLVLSMNSVGDVIYDVPLSPSVAEEAKTRADQAGLPVEKWIARAVEASIR